VEQVGASRYLKCAFDFSIKFVLNSSFTPNRYFCASLYYNRTGKLRTYIYEIPGDPGE